MDAIVTILINFLSQIFLTVGLIVIFGLLIALCQRAITSLIGSKAILITGAIGTPIHELSHALMCIIFGHKIVDIKLYQPDSDDGTLGYVNHTFNPSNLYHQVGNFFIGVAPILGGSGVIMLLMWLMAPDAFQNVLYAFGDVSMISMESFDMAIVGDFFLLFWEMTKAVFAFDNMGNIWWWLFIVIALMISTHMELSTADIKGGALGFLFLAGLLLVVDAILGLVYIEALETVTSVMLSFSLAVCGFLSVSLIFLLIMLIVAFVIKKLILRR